MVKTNEKRLISNNYILELTEVSKKDVNLVGVKAANLGELSQKGFNVPEGFVITTRTFEKFLDEAGISWDSSLEEVFKTEIPQEMSEKISDAVNRLDAIEVAVRSSGTAEDMPNASFAGQYETFLSVRGNNSIIDAIKKCWASAFGERVIEYRKSISQDSFGGMAVLVQKMVKADAAGVAFSVNPVTGDQEEVMVSAVKGLGERLVSGEASPDEWFVKGSKAYCQRSPEKAIDTVWVKAVAELARRVESYYGTPQDIEWALEDGTLYLLQARPVTALYRKPDLPTPEEGYWIKDDSHFAALVTPFGASVYLPALEHGMKVMCSEFGLPIEGFQQWSVGGEIYVRTMPYGAKEGKPPPSWLLYLLMRILPPMRRRLKIAREAFDEVQLDSLIEKWKNEWRDEFRQTSRKMFAIDLENLSDTELIKHLDNAIEFLHYGQDVHFRLMIPYLVRNWKLVNICDELLGWDITKAMYLLSGTSEASSEPGRKLAELARITQADEEAVKVITEGNNIISTLSKTAPKVADAFNDYLNEYGNRTTNYEPGSPTLAEKPDLLLQLLRDRLSNDNVSTQDPTEVRKVVERDARKLLEVCSKEDRERFERILKTAQQTNPIREDNVFYTDNVPNAVLRYTALEFGRRLTERGILADVDEVLFLTDAELRSTLEGVSNDFTPLIEKRKTQRAWVATHPGPQSYGEDSGPPPDPAVMPEPWRTMVTVQNWYMDLNFQRPIPVSRENQIGGVPGSSGRYTGQVRIIRDESGFSKLLPGEVLVCSITTPSWSILFTQAGAVVTDGGGVLSHAAVIARENGIPAVLGTIDVTRRLLDGQTVTVDGNEGIVEIY